MNRNLPYARFYEELDLVVEDRPMSKPPAPIDIWTTQKARALFARETFISGTLSPHGFEGVEPFTLQWFLNLDHQRHFRKARWVPRLLEFSKHSGEKLLGVGNGLGTDWVQYAKAGSAVTVCGSTAEDLALVRKNFQLRGLTGRFIHADFTNLPVESSSIDVACLGDALFESMNAPNLIQEIFRVLKPGGKVLALAPAYYDMDYWHHALFPWLQWLGRSRRNSTGWNERFSARRLRRLFAGFVEHRVHKRQLRHSEVPHIWRFLPLSLLQRIFGQVLILKAFKPLSAISTQPMAA
jgi:SAM-dependent methyltransferase